MKRIMFFSRGPIKIHPYLSARPSGEVDRGDCVSMSNEVTAHTVKRFPSPVRLVAVTARQACDARPCRPLLPDKDHSEFLSDLPDALTKVTTRPTPDAARGLEVGQWLMVFEYKGFPCTGRQHDGLSCFAIEQLLDRSFVRFLVMPLLLPGSVPLSCLAHDWTQRLALIPVRPSDADVHTNVTRQYVSRQRRRDFGELHKDTGMQTPVFALSHFAGGAELAATSDRILQGPMRRCWDRWAGGNAHPVRIARTFRFFERGVTEQREVSRTLKRLARGFLAREARVDDAPCALLRLVGNPAQAGRTLCLSFGLSPLGEILRAVVQRVEPIPMRGIAGLFRFARVRLDLQHVRAQDTRGLHDFGTSHFADLHLGQIRTSRCRGCHVWPQRLQSNGFGKEIFISHENTYRKDKTQGHPGTHITRSRQ